MKSIDDWMAVLPTIEQILTYHFVDARLLRTAFTHRSFANESRTNEFHNERLEFLGDSVLGLIVASYLYEKHPEMPEGELSALRARLVEASACAGYVQHLNLAPYLLLGKGEYLNQGRGRESILADLFEAVIGAIYLDGGLEAARHFFLQTLEKPLHTLISLPTTNWKACLQDLCQKTLHKTPIYIILKTEGPDHERIFEVAAYLEDKEIGRGSGVSKKQAEQAAAKEAFLQMKA